MKKVLTLLAFFAVLAGLQNSFGQFHFGAQLSALKNTKEDFGITGFGVHARLFLGKNLAIGGNIRIWPKKYEEDTEGSVKVRYGNFLGNTSGMLEYYFGERDIRPYVGMDAGFYFTNSVLQIKDGNTTITDESHSQSYFGLGPKIGLGLDLTSFIGFFGQIQYNALFGKAEKIESATFRSKPIDKFWSFDVGAYLRMKPAGNR